MELIPTTMIIAETVSSPIVTNIGATPSKFKIKASARAFQILSGFYSEPILAIPRELGANAWDSHVKAKNTGQPFEVHAPNELEPWFSIRDFGVGLSPEQIENIYTTYFESTKTGDNDSDGCMGLGSKTPFNYTQNFTVVSWWGGKRNVYSCFIDDKGSPNILQMNSEYSSEPNGLQVKFSVKHGDINSFVEKITKAYESFRHRPKIVGATITFTEPKYVMTGHRWSIRELPKYGIGGGCRALMGNYSYPINIGALSSAIVTLPIAERLEIRRALESGLFDFNFDIGYLDVAPNKEQLQYDGEHTAKNIVDLTRFALTELRLKIASEVGNPTTRWEAMYLCNKYNAFTGGSISDSVGKILGRIPITFNGEDVTGDIKVTDIHVQTDLIHVDVTSSGGPVFSEMLKTKAIDFIRTYCVYILNRKKHYNDTVSGVTTTPASYITGRRYEDQKIIFFYTNQTTIKRARIREYLNVNKISGDTPTYLIVDTSPDYSTLKTHIKYLGIPDSFFVNVDTLLKPTKPKQPRSTVRKQVDTTGMVKYAEIKNYTRDRYHRGVSFSYSPKKFVTSGTYYYTNIIGTEYKYNGDYVSDGAFLAAVIYANEHNLMGDGSGGLYAVHKKDVHFMDVGTWVNIFDLVHEHMMKKATDIQHQLYLFGTVKPQLYPFTNIIRWIESIGVDTLVVDLVDVDTKSFFIDLMGLHTTIGGIKSNFYGVLYELYGFKEKKNCDKSITIEEIDERFEVRYMGMLKHVVVTRSGYDITQDVVKFINFVDENLRSSADKQKN